MAKVLLILAVLAIPLGVLWLLQGLGLVVMDPILCFVNCTPIVGPVATWTIAGSISLALGLLALGLALRRLRA